MGRQIGIRVFQTVEHACGYWPERSARDLVLDPQARQVGLIGPPLAWKDIAADLERLAAESP